MRNSCTFLVTFVFITLALQSTFAFASGREGAAYVDAVNLIVVIVLVVFTTLIIGGGLQGTFRAGRSGQSKLKGCARGLLRGLLAFLVVGAMSIVALTALSILWVVYAFLDVYFLNPS